MMLYLLQRSDGIKRFESMIIQGKVERLEALRKTKKNISQDRQYSNSETWYLLNTSHSLAGLSYLKGENDSANDICKEL
jgi:hypothetical protein